MCVYVCVYMCVCMCVCLCVRERERERERDSCLQTETVPTNEQQMRLLNLGLKLTLGHSELAKNWTA